MLKKLIKIKKYQSCTESDTIDIDQCDNEVELEEEVNKIESSSSEVEDLCIVPNKNGARVISDSETENEDEVFCYAAPTKKRARVISDSEIENNLDAIDTSCDKEISAEKAADGTLWETLN